VTRGLLWTLYANKSQSPQVDIRRLTSTCIVVKGHHHYSGTFFHTLRHTSTVRDLFCVSSHRHAHQLHNHSPQPRNSKTSLPLSFHHKQVSRYRPIQPPFQARCLPTTHLRVSPLLSANLHRLALCLRLQSWAPVLQLVMATPHRVTASTWKCRLPIVLLHLLPTTPRHLAHGPHPPLVSVMAC
jgi:hypothetical protein